MYHTTAKTLIFAYRLFKENPDTQMTTGMWEHPVWTSKDFWSWFDKCLNEKINRNDNRKWRKLDSEYQSNLRRDAWKINDYMHGIRNTGCRGLLDTLEMRTRFPYISTQERSE
jgi:hypothetical protein